MAGNKSKIGPPDIRKQIVFHIIMARILGSYKRSCRYAYESLMSRSEWKQARKYLSSPLEPEDAIVSCNPEAILGSDFLVQFLNLYQRLSTSCMVLVLIKYILPMESILNAIFELEMPANCYIPGRLIVFYALLTKPVSIVAVSFHLGWRWWHYNKIRPETYNLFSFILEPDQKIQRFYDMVERGNDLDKCSSTNLYDIYLRNLLCYKVQYEIKTVYLLRANRTPKARLEMIEKIKRCTTVVLIVFFILFTTFFTLIMVFLASDTWYISSYPGCDIGLEQLRRNFSGGWSFTLTKHRFIMIVIDLVENVFVWMDSGVAATSVFLALTYLLNYDLVSLWRQIHIKLETIYNEHQKLMKNQPDVGSSSIGSRANVKGARIAPQHPTKAINRRGPKSTQSHELEAMINEIQFELCDCFKQIEAADVLMSDIISMALTIWFALISITTYYSFYIKYSLYVRLFQLGIFTLIVVVCLYLLELHKRTIKSYKLICSFMANDKSRYKSSFIQVLEFYTERNRSTYTIFHQYFYVPASNLTLLGWTLSCSTILENLNAMKTLSSRLIHQKSP